MRSEQPPRLATCLLKHFGCSPNKDAVIGDLDERYANGRSASWYWRQVLISIITSVVVEVRAHKLHAVRVLVLGWLLLFPLFWLQTNTLWALVQMSPHFWSPLASFRVVATHQFLWWAGVGWIIARLHRPHDRAMLLFLVMSLVPAFFLKLVVITRVLNLHGSQYLQVFGGAMLPLIALMVGGSVFTLRQQDRAHTSGA
jgi:hypothetical protein